MHGLGTTFAVRAPRAGMALLVTVLLLAVGLDAGPGGAVLAPSSSSLVVAATDPVDPLEEDAADSAVRRDRPLVVLLDTSGSMGDDDGTGTVKLAGAQASLAGVVRRMRPGATMGLWSYPGSDGSCSPGGFRTSASDGNPFGMTQRDLIGQVDGLVASGETPTGPALQALVEQLRARDLSGATVLLISDGLSNCGGDACAVAQQVRDEFDLTVQAAGFQISQEGLDELACIAGATGGKVFEANDTAELEGVVDAATRPELELAVEGMPSSTPAGSARRVTVTVTNPTAIDIADARISLSFAQASDGRAAGGGPSGRIIPAALPPQVSIANVRANTTYRRTWVVAFGSSGQTGRATYRVAAWGRNAQPVSAEGSVDVVDENQDLADATGAIADLEGRRIAILGDSYSSGEGAGDYVAGTDQDHRSGDNQCHKSYRTYMAPLFDRSDVELIACSGAITTSHIGGVGEPSRVVEEQVHTLRERVADEPVDAVFMTIGGNDIGFGEIIQNCLLGPGRALTLGDDVSWSGNCAGNQSFRRTVAARVDGVGAGLLYSYAQVYNTLNSADVVDDRGGSIAPVYVLAYPQIFPERQWSAWCTSATWGFNSDEIDFANQLVDDLNAEIESAVASAYRAGYRVYFVDTTQESFLPDNSACPRPGADPFVNRVSVGKGIGTAAGDVGGDNDTQELLHPNEAGYRAETNSILAWSVDHDPDALPDGRDDWRRPPARSSFRDLLPGLGWIARFTVPRLPATEASFDAASATWTEAPGDARAGQPVRVRVENGVPGSTVQLSVASEVTLIGSARVGDDGTAVVDTVLPADLAPGGHTLTVVSFAENGVVVGSHEVDVARALPWWLVPTAVASLVALLVGGFLGRRDRRRSRRAVTGPATSAQADLSMPGDPRMP